MPAMFAWSFVFAQTFVFKYAEWKRADNLISLSRSFVTYLCDMAANRVWARCPNQINACVPNRARSVIENPQKVIFGRFPIAVFHMRTISRAMYSPYLVPQKKENWYANSCLTFDMPEESLELLTQFFLMMVCSGAKERFYSCRSFLFFES